jgi:hypothetical protein
LAVVGSNNIDSKRNMQRKLQSSRGYCTRVWWGCIVSCTGGGYFGQSRLGSVSSVGMRAERGGDGAHVEELCMYVEGVNVQAEGVYVHVGAGVASGKQMNVQA